MKAYIFKYGRINGELNGKEIKEAEKKHGPLLGVIEGAQSIRVDRDQIGRQINMTPKRLKACKENIKKANRWGKKSKAGEKDGK